MPALSRLAVRLPRRPVSLLLLAVVWLAGATPSPADPARVDPSLRHQAIERSRRPAPAGEVEQAGEQAGRGSRSRADHDRRRTRALQAGDAAEGSATGFSVTIHFTAELAPAEVAELEARGVRFVRLRDGQIAGIGRFYPAFVEEALFDELAADPRVEYIESGLPGELHSPLDVSTAEVQADLRHASVLGDNPLGYNRGAGIIIADFDSGIDVFHPDFFFVDESVAPYEWIDTNGNGVFDPGVDRVDLDRDGVADPNERLEWWSTDPNPFVVDTRYNWFYHDANGNGTRDFGPDAGFGESDPTYGELVFMPIDRDGNTQFGPGDQLASLGLSKIRAVLDSDGTEYRRGFDLIHTPPDERGHGTSVASILVGQAAGYGRAAVGVAPDAELVMVNRDIGFDGGSGSLFSATAWARAEGADVFLWEFGAWTKQFLDGSSALEQTISELSGSQDSVHVIPNGNFAAAGRHAMVTLQPGQSAVRTLAVPSGIAPSGVFLTLLWQSDINAIDIAMRPAGGGAFVSMSEVQAIIPLDETHFVQSARSLSSRATGRWDGVLHASTGAVDPTLDWEVRIWNERSVPITVHLYASDSATSWSGGVHWPGTASTSHTVAWPATADQAINVGSYALNAPETGQLSAFSGRGPRIDGFDELLDVTAPGHSDIRAAVPADFLGRWGSYRTTFGGTSAAAPHVAGAAALLLQSVPNASVADVSEALRAGAIQDSFTGATYNQDWGHGKLRVEAAYWELAANLCPIIGVPGSPTPVNGASAQPAGGLALGWGASPAGQYYDVYFGTSSPPPLVAAWRTAPSFATGPLQPNQQYFWRVIARNDCNDPLGLADGGVSRSGPEWTFTTAPATQSGITIYDDSFAIVANGGEVVLVPKAGSVRDYTFRIQSTGTAPLQLVNTVTPVFVNDLGGTFEIAAQPATTVVPGDYTSFVLRVHENGGLAESTGVFIPEDTPDGLPFSFTVTRPAEAGMELRHAAGEVLPPGSPGSETVVQLPARPIGEMSTLFLHIYPTGEAPLELIGDPIVAISGPHASDFVVSVQPFTTVLSGGSEAFRLDFVPTAAGTRHATLAIATNSPLVPVYTVELVGVGIGCQPEIDLDCDGVADAVDNCPRAFNPTQIDRDGDGLGDECIILEIGRWDPVVTAPVHVVGDLLLAPRGSVGVTLLDISDRTAPQEIVTLDPGSSSTARLLPDQRIVSTNISPGRVDLLDSSFPQSPIIASLPIGTPGRIRNTNYIGYLQAGGDFHTVDLSAATGPAVRDTLVTPGNVFSIDVKARRAYVGESPGGLLIVDVTDPSNLQLLGTHPTVRPVQGVSVTGTTAYVAVDIDGFQILDVSNPASVRVLGGADTEEAEDVEIVGDLLFVADDFFGHLKVFDVSVPSAPVLVAQLDNVEYPREIERDADYLYVSDSDLRIFDLFPDNDGDGLDDRDEKLLGTGLLVPDSDGDGLSDGSEVHQYRTDPLLADSDGDGLDDPTELFGVGSNPLVADSDADGAIDAQDNCPLAPNGPLAGPNDQLDSDGDGLGDVCDPTPVPEPGLGLLRVAGLLCLVVLARRRGAARRADVTLRA